VRLEKEFKSNKAQLLSKIEIRKAIIENCDRLLEYYNDPGIADRDSIFFYLSSIRPTTFDPVQNDLVSSSAVEVLKNEALKQLLINWSTDVIQLQEVEQIFLRYGEQSFQSYTTEIGIQRDIAYNFWKPAYTSMLESKEVKNSIPGKLKLGAMTTTQLLTDPRLEGVIAQSLNLNQFNNQESETLMNRINQILEVLDAEIRN